jgi:hypothetical protein
MTFGVFSLAAFHFGLQMLINVAEESRNWQSARIRAVLISTARESFEAFLLRLIPTKKNRPGAGFESVQQVIRR